MEWHVAIGALIKLMIVGDISTNYLESTFNTGFFDIHLLWQFHVVQWLTIH